MKPSKRIVNPKKLINSKWTAVKPANKEKHFIVTQLLLPEQTDQPVSFIVLEAIFSKRSQTLAWEQLNDNQVWLQGWI